MAKNCLGKALNGDDTEWHSKEQHGLGKAKRGLDLLWMCSDRQWLRVEPSRFAPEWS